MMEAPPDRSTSPPLTIERPDANLERSRFLNTLGFGRTDAVETTAGGEPVTAETSAEAESAPETDQPEKSGEPLPQKFEPLDALASETEEKATEESEDGPKDEAAVEEMESASQGDTEEGDACDPDGLALRGDEGGPAFLASRGEFSDDADDWERDLLVGDHEDLASAHSSGLGAALLQKPAAREMSDEATETTSLAPYAWSNPVATMGKEDAEKDTPTEQPGGGSEASSPLPGGTGPNTLDFETFSERLKTVATWRPPTAPAAPSGDDGTEATWTPPAETRPEMGTPSETINSLNRESDGADAAEPVASEGTRIDTAGAPDSVKETAPVGDTGIVDLACPQCGKGLSLRREHLGIAGQCVWCEAPLVAAASPLEGVVRIYLIKPGSSPVEERCTSPNEPAGKWDAPATQSPAQEIADASPLEPLAETEDSEMVEPEVIGSLDESSPEQPTSDAPSMPAWQSPVSDSAASMWAERASAVRRSLTGEPADPDAPAAEDSTATESFADQASPLDGGHPPAFSWMEPKLTPPPAEPEPETEPKADFSPETEVAMAKESESGKSPPEQSAPLEAAPTSSAFDWNPPGNSLKTATEPETEGAAPENKESESPKPGEGFSTPFAGIGAAITKAGESDPSDDFLGDLSVSPSTETPREPLNDPFGAAGLLVESDDEKPSPTEGANDPFATFNAAAASETETPATLNSLLSNPERAESKPGISLFQTGKLSPESDKAENESDSDPTTPSDAPPAEVAAESAPPKDEIAAVPESKPDKKARKTEKVEKLSKAGSKSVAPSGGAKKLAKKLVLLVVIAGLLAGMAAAALYFKQIAATMKPILQPLLERVSPGAEEVPEAPTPPPAPPAAESAEATTPATGAPAMDLPDRKSQAVSTGAVEPSTPDLITIPEKKSLFGGGSLLINDGGAQSDGINPSE